MKAFLLLVSACTLTACASTHRIDPRFASPAVDFGAAQQVDVRLANFSFAPDQIELQAGKPYVLRIVNTESGGHDFTAPEFFAAASIAPVDAARVNGGQIVLQGNETASIRLVPAAGTYKLACTHFGHAALGMTGKIIVR